MFYEGSTPESLIKTALAEISFLLNCKKKYKFKSYYVIIAEKDNIVTKEINVFTERT